ncbi:hypothetical protein MKZ38_009258 [Zalerion maritima]|uniref:Cell wall protein PhiA n=1 Tax=Zalerion maritima TaxID=339359 RepID=A0AAD5RUS2_9PEZI|nr:hypothetical protein MKZ38_009258 [Zalerion maritima]
MPAAKFIALATALLGAVSASPCKPTGSGSGSNSTDTFISTGTTFSLMALRSGSEVHFQTFSAAKGSFFLALPSSNATCTDGSEPDSATFTLSEDGELLLYGEEPQQKAFADRSGMGQGKFGYMGGNDTAGTRWETTGFELDETNDLTLNGAEFLACPNSIDSAWSVWMNAGVENPAGNEGCLGIMARAVKATDPVMCEYTTS